MAQNITYGLGGWCSECSPEHDHPFENILEITEIPDEPVIEILEEPVAEIATEPISE